MHISNKCSIAVHCLIFIYEYGEEKKVTSELLSLSTGCNPVTIRNIISAMKKDGIKVEQLANFIRTTAAKDNVHGILIQLPLNRKYYSKEDEQQNKKTACSYSLLHGTCRRRRRYRIRYDIWERAEKT